MKKIQTITSLLCFASMAFLAGCGLGSPKATTVGGTVTGLSGTSSVVLTDGSVMLPIHADGPFHFDTESNAHYNITVNAHPDGQTCVVTNGSGYTPISGASVTNITVVCSASVRVGGTVSGLVAGASVVLQDNGADDITVSANGTFTFPVPIAEGAAYSVTVKTQPSGQTCTVTNGIGSADTSNAAAANNVIVSCAGNTVGGTLSGLASGATIVLQNNATNDLTLSANGAFTFSTTLATGTVYAVTVLTQPFGQTCTVANATGTIDPNNTTASNNVLVTCVSTI
jgi:hypothetical protein